MPDGAAQPEQSPAEAGLGQRRRRAPPAESAEARALLSEEQRTVAGALRRLPERQREALLLRYYLDLSEQEIAAAVGVSRGTVKSATSRGIAAVGRVLKEES
jgi:RNA polymerase sigma factor (sigma-70 family)